MEQKQTHGNWSSGFLFGLVFGVALTLLFTTKKGRRIFKALTDEGMQRVSRWEDLLERLPDDYTDEEEVLAEDNAEYVVPEKPEMRHVERTNGTTKRVSRRFFKGVPKRS